MDNDTQKAMKNKPIPVINRHKVDIIACIQALENGVKNIYLIDEYGKYKGEGISRFKRCIMKDEYGEWGINFIKLPSIHFDKPITGENYSEIRGLAEQAFKENNDCEELPIVNSSGQIISLAGKILAGQSSYGLEWRIFTVPPRSLQEKKIYISSIDNPRLSAFANAFQGKLKIECLAHDNYKEVFSNSPDILLVYENDIFPECNKISLKELHDSMIQELLVLIDDDDNEARNYFKNGPALCLVSTHDKNMKNIDSLVDYDLEQCMAVIVPDEFEIERKLDRLGLRKYVHFHELHSLNLSVDDIMKGFKDNETSGILLNRYRYVQAPGFIRDTSVDGYSAFEYGLSVATIMKDAGLYLQEWIDYHLLAGVEHFYFYDHESVDNTKEILQPYIDKGVVDYYVWPDEMGLMSAYNDAIINSRFKTKYLAIIDDDEFLLPLVNASVLDVLEYIFEKNVYAGGLCVTWRLFGSSGHIETPQEGTLRAFCKREDDMKLRARHGKLVLNPRRVLYMLDPHYAEYVVGYHQINEYGECLFRNFNTRPDRLICLNHYVVKSAEEWKKRRSRIPADNRKSSMRPDSQFSALNSYTNSIYDDNILRYAAARRTTAKVYGKKSIYTSDEIYHSYIDELTKRIISFEGKVAKTDIEQLFVWFYNSVEYDYEHGGKLSAYIENIFYICLNKLVKNRMIDTSDLQMLFAFLLKVNSKNINKLLCANIKDILGKDALYNYIGLSPRLTYIHSLVCGRLDVKCSDSNTLQVLPWGERNLVRIDAYKNCTGATIHGWDEAMFLRIFSSEDDTITLSLRGVAAQDKNGLYLPLKITYTSVVINYSADKISVPIDVTYESDYKIIIPVRKNKNTDLIIRYKPYKYSDDELMDILRFLSKSSFVREM